MSDGKPEHGKPVEAEPSDAIMNHSEHSKAEEPATQSPPASQDTTMEKVESSTEEKKPEIGLQSSTESAPQTDQLVSKETANQGQAEPEPAAQEETAAQEQTAAKEEAATKNEPSLCLKQVLEVAVVEATVETEETSGKEEATADPEIEATIDALVDAVVEATPAVTVSAVVAAADAIPETITNTITEAIPTVVEADLHSETPSDHLIDINKPQSALDQQQQLQDAAPLPQLSPNQQEVQHDGHCASLPPFPPGLTGSQQNVFASLPLFPPNQQQQQLDNADGGALPFYPPGSIEAENAANMDNFLDPDDVGASVNVAEEVKAEGEYDDNGEGNAETKDIDYETGKTESSKSELSTAEKADIVFPDLPATTNPAILAFADKIKALPVASFHPFAGCVPRGEWASRDLEEYRKGYPSQSLNDERQNDNFLFYSNELRSRPDNMLIDDIHKEWRGNYDLLEVRHGFIQWLFPIHEHGMNYSSQVLQRHEKERMRTNQQIRQRILESYALMLDFYGFELADRTTGQIRRLEQYRPQFSNLNTSGHNYLRITRILKCLGEMDYEEFKIPFLIEILSQVLEGELTQTTTSCMDYWIPTIKNDVDRDALLNIVQYMGKFHKKVNRWW